MAKGPIQWMLSALPKEAAAKDHCAKRSDDRREIDIDVQVDC